MKKLLLILLMAIVVCTASAQKTRFSVSAGWNFAIANFSKINLSTDDWALISPHSTSGGAGMGYDFGLSILKPVGMDGKVYIKFSADYLYNDVSLTVRNNNNTMMMEGRSNFEKISIQNPHFINVPILLGFHYESPIAEKLAFYLECQGGVALRWITDRGAEMVGAKKPLVIGTTNLYDYIYTDHYNNSYSFAFRVAIGIAENDHWLGEIALWNMGSMRIDGYEDYEMRTDPNTTTRTTGIASFSAGIIVPVTITFGIGYRF
ncbi:MAG: hypothetical protein IIY87_05755 [Bacteroidales bacterium]|nr:hypothetical protein [Bacteroidales bacterium]